MKYSIYNNYVKYGEAFIAFNAMTMRFLYLVPELMDLINGHLPSQIETIHPEFYHALMDNGFICDDITNEIAEARNLISTVNNTTKSYRLIINPTTNCNFHCWYCYENHSKVNKMDVTVKKTFAYI